MDFTSVFYFYCSVKHLAVSTLNENVSVHTSSGMLRPFAKYMKLGWGDNR